MRSRTLVPRRPTWWSRSRAARVEDFGLSGSIGAISTEVRANTWATSSHDVRAVTRSDEDIVMGRATESVETTEADQTAGGLRFDVEAMSPPIVNEYGSARTTKRVFWPVLESLSMFSLHVGGDGIREPHRHPKTAEMGYVLAGRARMTIRSPARTWTRTCSDGGTPTSCRAHARTT